MLHILSYQHEKLYRLVSKALANYNDNSSSDVVKEPAKFPISLLVSSYAFLSRDTVALSPRFRARMCTIAAKLGDVTALQLMYEHGCPWDENMFPSGTLRQPEGAPVA